MKICKFQVITLDVGGYYLYSEIWEGAECTWNNKALFDDLSEVFSAMQETIDMSNEKLE